MAKPKGKYINFSEEWEINDWLERNGFRKTSKNRDYFVIYGHWIKKKLKMESSENLSWDILDDYHILGDSNQDCPTHPIL